MKYKITTKSCWTCKYYREFKKVKCKKKQPPAKKLIEETNCKYWG